jgi:hypothetical protein
LPACLLQLDMFRRRRNVRVSVSRTLAKLSPLVSLSSCLLVCLLVCCSERLLACLSVTLSITPCARLLPACLLVASLSLPLDACTESGSCVFLPALANANVMCEINKNKILLYDVSKVHFRRLYSVQGVQALPGPPPTLGSTSGTGTCTRRAYLFLRGPVKIFQFSRQRRHFVLAALDGVHSIARNSVVATR